MANAFRKAANFLGLVDDEESMEQTVVLNEDHHPRTFATVSNSTTRVSTAPSYLQTPTPTQAKDSVVNRIVTLHPRVYADAKTIGEYYRDGQPVIINLSDMEENERRRMIDFSAGLVFGHYGKIEIVTSRVYLLTPQNVQVTSEEKSAAANASFFNQS